MIQKLIRKTNDKFLIYLICGCFIFISVSILLPNVNDNDFFINVGLSLFQFSGIILLLKHSSILSTDAKYLKAFYFLIAIQFVAAILKVQHWPGFEAISILSSIGFIITYSYRFICKTNKENWDLIKLCWVILAFSNSFFTGKYIMIGEILYIASINIFLCIIFHFLLENWKLIFLRK